MKWEKTARSYRFTGRATVDRRKLQLLKRPTSMKVSNVLEMRAMDRAAMERFGIPEEILMENAGEAVCSVIRNEIGIVGKKFIIFCGLGNNGGDGFVVARKLFSNGAHVRVIILGDGSRYRGAAALNLNIVARLSIPVQEIHSAESIKTVLYHSDVVIDAIFGTGLARTVEGMYRDVIQLINGSRKPVVSADIPSGIAGDTGKILGECIRADFTVTFGLRNWVISCFLDMISAANSTSRTSLFPRPLSMMKI